MKLAPIVGFVAAFVATSAHASESSGPLNPGIEVEVVYTGDVWRNMRGGVQVGTRYLDNLDATLALDAERWMGWRGVSLFFHGLYNNGESVSAELVGDQQALSNIETGVEATRLYEAWIEQSYFDRRASLRAGLYDLNSEFDAIEAAALFLNSSHGIGADFSQSGRNGPSIFPSTSLAIRGAYAFDDSWTTRLAVLDGVPGDPEYPERTRVDLSNEDGALITAELGYARSGIRAALGHWSYTAEHETLLSPTTSARGNDGVYGYLEASRGQWAGWMRAGIADTRFNPIERYFGGGLVRTGPITGRDDDAVGIAVAWVGFGEDYRRARAGEGLQIESGELALELTYRVALGERFAVQPNLQYIANPSGDRTLDDAVAVGLRFEAVLWSAAR